MKRPTVMLWHKDHDLQGVDCVVLPGGFSYGDYLRAGAIARFSPLMQEVKAFARRRRPRPRHLQRLPDPPRARPPARGHAAEQEPQVPLPARPHPRSRTPGPTSPGQARKGQVLRIPIAHFDGNYYAPARVLKDLERNGQVVFRYCDAGGELTAEANVNGSLASIAGIRNEAGNVLGLMPHPERASEALLGSEDGRTIFESLILSLERRKPARRPASGKKARHDR